MKKIIDFIKKYKYWILVVIVASLIGVLIWVFLGEEEDIETVEPLRMESPYYLAERDINITLPLEIEKFDEREPVLKVIKPEGEEVREFMEENFNLDTQLETYNEFSEYIGENLLSYSSTDSTMYFYSSNGFKLYPSIYDENSLKNFFKKYFGWEEINNELKEDVEEGFLYVGHYRYKGLNIGSTSIEGMSYRVKVNSTGGIVELKALLLRPEDLVLYQYMPTSTVDQLVSINNYPMYTVNNSIEESFYEKLPLLRASAELETIEIKNIETIYVLHDTEYIFPTYKLSGEGSLKDSQSNRFWSQTDVFICAVDPEYLYERESEMEYFNPVPYIPESE